MTVAAHIVGQTSDTSHLTMEERLAMTREQRKLRSLGSKWSMVGWYTYITLIWTLKFNMLCFYQRVVGGVWVRKFIKPTMGLVAVSGLAIYILFAVSCRPFHKLWQVLPAPGGKYVALLRCSFFAYSSSSKLLSPKSCLPNHSFGAQFDNRSLHYGYTYPSHHSSEDFDTTQNWTALALRWWYVCDDGSCAAGLLRTSSRSWPNICNLVMSRGHHCHLGWSSHNDTIAMHEAVLDRSGLFVVRTASSEGLPGKRWG